MAGAAFHHPILCFCIWHARNRSGEDQMHEVMRDMPVLFDPSTDMDEENKAAEYTKHQIALLQVLFRRAGPDWLNLGKLVHESGEWYGWNFKG